MFLIKNIRSSLTSYIVFFLTLTVVCLHLTSVVFPALIVTITSPHENNLDLLTIGPAAVPLFITNISLFSVGFLYYKKKLPGIIQGWINYVLTFELSRKPTFFFVTIILLIYVGFSVSELTIDEETQWGDYKIFKEALKVWPVGESEDPVITEQRDRHVRMLLLSTSLNVFQNVKIIPYASSILLLIVTYFLTKEISGKRFAGIISMLVILQSYIFLRYDTVAVYENFWVLFYVLSLYLIYKKWYLSPLSYIMSIFSKAVTASFLPMSIFFVCRAEISNRKKIITVLLYTAVIGISFAVWQLDESVYIEMIQIDFSDFWIGTTAWSYQLRFDSLIVFTILPLTVGLFMKSRQKLRAADSVMVLILGAFLTGPVLVMLTDTFFILPYRFVPLIVFFAIGVGTFLSKITNQ